MQKWISRFAHSFVYLTTILILFFLFNLATQNGAPDSGQWSNTGILLPGSISGNRQSNQPCLSRRASSLSYRSAASTQSGTTSDCSTPTGTITDGGATLACSPDSHTCESAERTLINSSLEQQKPLPQKTHQSQQQKHQQRQQQPRNNYHSHQQGLVDSSGSDRSRLPNITNLCSGAQSMQHRSNYAAPPTPDSDWGSSSCDSQPRARMSHTISSLPPQSLITFRPKSLPSSHHRQQHSQAGAYQTGLQPNNHVEQQCSTANLRSQSRENNRSDQHVIYVGQKKKTRSKTESFSGADGKTRPYLSKGFHCGVSQSVQSQGAWTCTTEGPFDRASSVGVARNLNARDESVSRPTSSTGFVKHSIGGRSSEPRSLPQYSQQSNCHSHTQIVSPYQPCVYTPDQGRQNHPANSLAANGGYNMSITKTVSGGCGTQNSGHGTTFNNYHSFGPATSSASENQAFLSTSNLHLSGRSKQPITSMNQPYSPTASEYQQATVDARLVSSPTVGSILRLPGKQTSLDEICTIPHAINQQQLGNSSAPIITHVAKKSLTNNKSRTASIPSSNSATSSLSAGDEKIFCDSGISSSSYSKDSACTSPSDQQSLVKSAKLNEQGSKSFAHNADYRQEPSSELVVDQCTSRKTNDPEPRRANSVFPSTYSAVPQLGVMRARSTEPQSCQMVDKYTNSGSATQSKIQRPTTIVSSAEQPILKAANETSGIMMTPRQKARELYSLVRNREEKRIQIDPKQSSVTSSNEIKGESRSHDLSAILSNPPTKETAYLGQSEQPGNNEWRVLASAIEASKRKVTNNNRIDGVSTKQSTSFPDDSNFKVGTFMSHSQYTDSDKGRFTSSNRCDLDQNKVGGSKADL